MRFCHCPGRPATVIARLNYRNCQAAAIAEGESDIAAQVSPIIDRPDGAVAKSDRGNVRVVCPHLFSGDRAESLGGVGSLDPPNGINLPPGVGTEEKMRPDHQDDMRAADYVLGLMTPVELVRFELDLRADPALALEVDAWRERVARLREDADPTPQAEMRRRISDGLSRRSPGPQLLAAAPKQPRFILGRLEAVGLGILMGMMLGATLVWVALG
jgi:hypothetical protein